MQYTRHKQGLCNSNELENPYLIWLPLFFNTVWTLLDSISFRLSCNFFIQEYFSSLLEWHSKFHFACWLLFLSRWSHIALIMSRSGLWGGKSMTDSVLFCELFYPGRWYFNKERWYKKDWACFVVIEKLITEEHSSENGQVQGREWEKGKV